MGESKYFTRRAPTTNKKTWCKLCGKLVKEKGLRFCRDCRLRSAQSFIDELENATTQKWRYPER